MTLFSRIAASPIAASPMTLAAPSAPVPRPATGDQPRFAGDPVYWVSINVALATSIAAFARSSLRSFTGSAGGVPGNPGSAWSLFELTPLPAFGRNVFQAIRFGLPVQYVIVPSGTTPVSDLCVASGETIASVPIAWFGVCFQDRITRDPAAWSAEIARALAATGTAAGDWPAFAADLAAMSPRSIRILDHRGQPANSGSFNIVVNGGAPATVTPADGDTGITAGTTITIGSTATTIVAGAEQEGGLFGTAYQLSPGERHVHVLDAEDWYAPAANALDRWRPDSDVEPIVDGTPYFRRLVDDLRSTKGGGGAYLAGWAFKKASLLDSTKRWRLVPKDAQSELADLIIDLNANGSEVRLLVNQFLQLDVTPLDDVNLLPILFAVYAAMMPFDAFGVMTTDAAGFGVLLAGIAAAGFILTSASITQSLLETFAEASKPLVDSLPPGIATWSRNPVRFHDNPMVAGPLDLGIVTVDDVSHVGVYHQKLVVLRPAGGDLLGYLGGIDINSDRIDTPLHRALFPFHDVQLRVRGPAVTDMATTFRERLLHDGGSVSFAPAPPVPAAGNHLVQIARTYFQPRAGSGTPALPFAPNGERLIYDTLLKAIDAARDFIYIEEQYFTPGNEYVDHLIAAASHGVRALVITVPTLTDQTFGQIRRTEIFAALGSAWGTRLRVGAPLRRFVNPTPEAHVNLGRCILLDAIDTDEASLRLGPGARVPEPPFWLFIDNELMFIESTVSTDAAGNVKVNVHRSGVTAGADWGANVNKHDKGAPALCVRIPGIYVHAKLMIVDDVFLSVGSSNLNRRGHFHDGEINAFTVSQHLRGDPRNPARLLRCRLWAEHLGLSPEMGLSLFSDPFAALPYFSRSWYAGSRWTKLNALFDAPPLTKPIGTGTSIGSELLKIAIGASFEALETPAWKGLVDPTTTQDPNALIEGPEYP